MSTESGTKREEKVVVSSFVFAIGKRKSPPKVEWTEFRLPELCSG
jgi:hypothetical protein